MHLSWIDYAIVLVYVGGTIVAGTLARGAIKGISDFLVAGLRVTQMHHAAGNRAGLSKVDLLSRVFWALPQTRVAPARFS